jgi:YVTN family beta-propeller protein
MNLSALAVTFALCVSATAQESLLVLSKRDHTLAVVDAASLKVVEKFPSGDDPHEVIASADGRTAWISNYGFGSLHTLTAIDLAGHKSLPAVDLGPLSGPHGLDFVAGKVWFTAEGAKAIGSYDPDKGKIDFVLGTGQNRTHMIYVLPDAQYIVTTNVSSGTVSLIDKEAVRMGPPPGAPPGTGPPGMGPAGGGNAGPPPPQPPPRYDWNQTVVKVGNGSEGFDLSPDLKEIWTANAQDGTISVIDRGLKTVVATLAADVRGANRLKFTPDGAHVLVSTLAGRDLTVLDARKRTVVKRVAIGHGAAGILIEPNGNRAFVACGPDNYVAVIDLKTLTVTGHIEAGGEPDGLAWAVRR